MDLLVCLKTLVLKSGDAPIASFESKAITLTSGRLEHLLIDDVFFLIYILIYNLYCCQNKRIFLTFTPNNPFDPLAIYLLPYLVLLLNHSSRIISLVGLQIRKVGLWLLQGATALIAHCHQHTRSQVQVAPGSKLGVLNPMINVVASLNLSVRQVKASKSKTLQYCTPNCTSMR